MLVEKSDDLKVIMPGKPHGGALKVAAESSVTAVPAEALGT